MYYFILFKASWCGHCQHFIKSAKPFITKYIEDNDYQIIDNVRECYIDGCWNKDSSDEYLTEIEFPVRKM